MYCQKFKEAAKAVLGLTLVLLFVVQTASYVQAGRPEWDIDIPVVVNKPKHVLNMFYMDENGISIGNDRTLGPFILENEEMEAYEIEADVIYGYDYVSYCYEDVVTGYKSPVVEGSKKFNLLQIDKDNFVPDSVYERNVYVKYRRDISKIRYRFDTKYVDETGEVQLNDPYTNNFVGTVSAFRPQILDVIDYEYKGYYYKNLSEDTYSKGSLEELLNDKAPVIAVDQKGNDTQGVDCTYEVYAVYAKKEVPVEETYTVIYDSNGAKGTVKDEKKYQKGDRVTVLKADELTLSEYLFDGWNTQKDGKGTSYKPEDTFAITEDVTLYAQWSEEAEEPNPTEDPDDKKKHTPTPTFTPTSTATPQVQKTTSQNYKSGTTTANQSVKTGDETPVAVYGLIAALAGAVVIYKIYSRKKVHNSGRI